MGGNNLILYFLQKWLVDIDIQLFRCHPTRKLLVLINQSFYFIYFWYNFFDWAKQTNTYENKIEEITFADIDLFYFSSFIFKKNYCFIEEENLQKKLL